MTKDKVDILLTECHLCVILKPTISIRPLVPPSGSHKCLRFGLWSTQCTIKDFLKLFIFLLTYLRALVYTEIYSGIARFPRDSTAFLLCRASQSYRGRIFIASVSSAALVRTLNTTLTLTKGRSQQS